ncbi:OPT/YSL family transporter [Candidatus Poribacteria bacterium]|nr:OPT/YSL family transporter [Candidatus Poribacteria bacterium]
MKNNSSNRVTWRSIIFGVVLSIPHGYFSIQTPTPTTVSLIYTVVLTILFLVAINLLIKRWLPKAALTQGELLTIYTMLSLSVAIAGHDMLQVLAPVLGHAFWFSTPENEWSSLFFRYLPRWLVVDDTHILKELYQGESTFYFTPYLKAWLAPVFWWSVLLFALMLVMVGLNIIISRQWIQHERLSYPIIQLPMAMIQEGGQLAFFRSKLLWLGIAVSGGIDLINGLHAFFPAIPLLPVRTIEIGRLFTDEPWRAMGWTPICFFPFAIGLSFFMPLDLSFSCWVFYWIWKMELVLGRAVGWHSLPEFPYLKPQASGGYLGIALIGLWKGRHHLRQVGAYLWKSVPGHERRESRRGVESTQRELQSQYRIAIMLILIGITTIVLFCTKAGMSLGIIAIFFTFYFLLVFALTRLRAELGPPVNELYNIGPDQMLPKLFGTRRIGARNLTMFAMFWGFNRAHRCNPMPYQLEGLKMADLAGTPPKRLILAMLIASFVGIWIGFWGFLHVHYQDGFGGGFGWEAYRHLQRWLYYMPGIDAAATTFIGVGFGVVVVLTFLRTRFLWWALHPAAYPLASSLNWTMSWMWASIFVSWLIKWILLKHGGLTTYRRAIPFFFGLILGDYLVGGVWNIWGVLSHRYIYTFWH